MHYDIGQHLKTRQQLRYNNINELISTSGEYWKFQIILQKQITFGLSPELKRGLSYGVLIF